MIRAVAATGSTNRDLLAAGAAEGDWLRADQQTAGRGRDGRSWVSPPGNLYASTLVRLQPGDPPAPGLALVAGVALHEVASAYANPGALRLKWPNDLLAGAAKLAGILLEREEAAVVVGFGVNLVHHPDIAGRATTDFATLAGAAPEAADLLVELAAAFARWLGRWRGGHWSAVREAWLARAHAVGTPIAFTAVDGRRDGLFDGLAADGALRLRRADGTVQLVHAGDVALL